MALIRLFWSALFLACIASPLNLSAAESATNNGGGPANKPFDPLKSVTFHSANEAFEISYLGGDQVKGNLMYDVVTLGSSAAYAAFGGFEVTQSQPWPFASGWVGDGILGLAPWDNDLEPTVFYPLFGMGGGTDLPGGDSPEVQKLENVIEGSFQDGKPTLGLLMDRNGGKMYVGEALPQSSYQGDLQRLAVLPSAEQQKTVWQVELESVNLGGTVLWSQTPALDTYAADAAVRRAETPANGAVLDTGAACIGLPTDIHAAFMRALPTKLDKTLTFAFKTSSGSVNIQVPFTEYVIDPTAPVKDICVVETPMFQLGDPFFRSAAIQFVFDKVSSSVDVAQRSTIVSSSDADLGSPLVVSRLVPKAESSRARQISGLSAQGAVRYLVEIGLGSQRQKMSLLIDTGSSLMIVYSSTSINLGLIIGLSVAGGVVLVLLVMAGIFWWRRRGACARRDVSGDSELNERLLEESSEEER